MSTPEERAAELRAVLADIVELSNQALRLRSMSGSTLRTAVLMQIRDRATGAIQPQGETNGNADK